LGVKLKVTPVDAPRYNHWSDSQGRPRYIVTLLARTVTAAQTAALTQVLSDQGLNIEVITRLSGRPPLEGDCRNPACIEFFVRGRPADLESLRKTFLELSAEHAMDIAFQEDNVFRRTRRLVAFDMDSTLIAAELIDEMARVWGKGEEVARVTEAAMRGEMDFKESLSRRLELLRGLPVERLERLAETIPLTEGAEKCVANLKRFGYKIAIISGGFTFFGKKLQQRLGIDFLHANELEMEDGRLTGRVQGPVVDAARKAELLEDIAAQESISLQQVVAVGDGANDLPMLGLAGLGIAFHAKPVVREGARQAISTLGLDSLLYLMGVREREMIAAAGGTPGEASC
jgi:phosphoserine phosphatase